MKHLLKSLASFQQEVPVLHKATKGHNYTYTELSDIVRAINPLMQKHGLGFTQMINSKESGNYLKTVIFHAESGETIESECFIPLIQLHKMNEYQVTGSGITYFRRYSLSSLLGLVTDSDIDAAGVQIKPESKPTETENNSDEKKTLSVAQFNLLIGMIRTGQPHEKHGVLTVEKAKTLWNLNEEQILTLNDLQNEA
jgi:hypothetical protein